MSRLFGPFSDRRSNVSLRDCACAEKTAGAVTALLAASADADLRKSRRFIENSPGQPPMVRSDSLQAACQIGVACGRSLQGFVGLAGILKIRGARAAGSCRARFPDCIQY